MSRKSTSNTPSGLTIFLVIVGLVLAAVLLPPLLQQPEITVQPAQVNVDVDLQPVVDAVNELGNKIDGLTADDESDAEADAADEAAEASDQDEEPAATQAPASGEGGFSEEEISSENDLPIIEFVGGRGNIPAEVVTIKVNNTDGCTMPSVACYMLDDKGVLGADDYYVARDNPSAVWTGSAWHQMAQTPTVGIIVPEGSYATWYSISSTVEGGGYHLEFDSVGDNRCAGVLVRGWFAETHVDRHLAVNVYNYGATGAMTYTRYAVPVEAGQFFSQDYATDQAKNALDFDNAGIGSEDCELFRQYVFDYNDGSLVVMDYTAEAGWVLVYTNIVGHGRN